MELVIYSSFWQLLLLHLFNGFFPGQLGWAGTRKVNHSGFYWSKRWLGGSGISWTICKSFAPRFRQITTPVPHHSVFADRTPLLPPNQQHQSTENISSFWQRQINSSACWIFHFQSLMMFVCLIHRWLKSTRSVTTRSYLNCWTTCFRIQIKGCVFGSVLIRSLYCFHLLVWGCWSIFPQLYGRTAFYIVRPHHSTS